MRRHTSTMMLGLLLVAFGFVWLASDQGWITISRSLILAIGAMLLGTLLIIRALLH